MNDRNKLIPHGWPSLSAPQPTAAGAGDDSPSVTEGGNLRLNAEGAVGSGEDQIFSHPELSNGHRWGQQADEEELPMNTIFEIAKNERRQLVLQYLADADSPVSLGELAEHIASHENDKPMNAITASERKRVYVGLHQCHIPKMEDAKVVNVDRQEGISLGKHAHEVLDILAFDGHDHWYRYYGALSMAGIATVLVLSLASLQPVASVVLGGYAVLVGLIALLHANANR